MDDVEKHLGFGNIVENGLKKMLPGKNIDTEAKLKEYGLII